MSTKKKENKKYWELKTKLQGAEQRDHLKCSARDTRARHNKEKQMQKKNNEGEKTEVEERWGGSTVNAQLEFLKITQHSGMQKMQGV